MTLFLLVIPPLGLSALGPVLAVAFGVCAVVAVVAAVGRKRGGE